MERSRYDGLADWYDQYVEGIAKPISAAADELIRGLLGRGTGSCLDVGCGGGHHAPALAGLGWSVLGIDSSWDQLRLAAGRGQAAVLGDAAALPFASGSVDAVVTIMTSTDFDDLGGTLAECNRVLSPNGKLVLVGSHPSFGGPFVERHNDGRLTVHPGYRDHRRVEDHPLLGDGVRRRAGVVNVPLQVLLNAVLEAGFSLQRVSEDSGRDPIPGLLGLDARPAK